MLRLALLSWIIDDIYDVRRRGRAAAREEVPCTGSRESSGGLALLVACAVALGVAPEVALADEVSYLDVNCQVATADATEVTQDDWQWGNGMT